MKDRNTSPSKIVTQIAYEKQKKKKRKKESIHDMLIYYKKSLLWINTDNVQ